MKAYLYGPSNFHFDKSTALYELPYMHLSMAPISIYI